MKTRLRLAAGGQLLAAVGLHQEAVRETAPAVFPRRPGFRAGQEAEEGVEGAAVFRLELSCFDGMFDALDAPLQEYRLAPAGPREAQ